MLNKSALATILLPEPFELGSLSDPHTRTFRSIDKDKTIASNYNGYNLEGDVPPYAKHWNLHHVEEEYIPGDEGGNPDNLSACGESHEETT